MHLANIKDKAKTWHHTLKPNTIWKFVEYGK